MTLHIAESWQQHLFQGEMRNIIKTNEKSSVSCSFSWKGVIMGNQTRVVLRRWSICAFMSLQMKIQINLTQLVSKYHFTVHIKFLKITGNVIISCILLPALAVCTQEWQLYWYALSGNSKHCRNKAKRFKLIILRKVRPVFHRNFVLTQLASG